ncbi:MAG: hypothetical protein PHX14_10440, partial [Syntrophomonadaceae bacterium]|nr:hypothetical protein [Syntrophomonadaceae bacterium]
LQTEPQGSAHTRVIKMVGGVNVAKVPMKGGKGLTPVSLEQVLFIGDECVPTATSFFWATTPRVLLMLFTVAT